MRLTMLHALAGDWYSSGRLFIGVARKGSIVKMVDHLRYG